MDLTFNLSDVLTGGKHRSIFQDLIVLYGQQFVRHDRTNNITKLLNLSQNEFDSKRALELANNDVLIEHWSISILAPKDILNLSVPSELPNNTTTDEEGNEYPVKFKNWGDQPLIESNDEEQVILRGVINGNSINSNLWKQFENKNSNIRKSIDSQWSLDNYEMKVLSPIDLNKLKQEDNWIKENI